MAVPRLNIRPNSRTCRAPWRRSARQSCPSVALPSTAAVSAIVSVPWVITMRVLGDARGSAPGSARGPASVICRLSIIISVSISTSSRQRPSRSISRDVRVLEEELAGELVVFLVEGAAGDEDADRFHGRAASSASIARYIGVIPMRGMRWLLLVAIAAILGGVAYRISGTKKTTGREHAGCSRTAFGRTSAPPPSTGNIAITTSKTGRIKSDIEAESHAAGERRVPCGSQERHHEGLQQGRQDLRPGEERRRHVQYAEKSLSSAGRGGDHPGPAVEGAARQTSRP